MEKNIDGKVSRELSEKVTEQIVSQIKTRVPVGEKYWFVNVNSYCTAIWVDYDIEGRLPCVDKKRFDSGNYSHTEKGAEVMARKLNAVLKGADVIKMPSKEEFDMIRPHESLNIYDEETNGKARGWKDCFCWLKSKIVK